MKKLLMALLTSVAFYQASAADGQWLTDFAKANEKAKTENKMILLVEVDFPTGKKQGAALKQANDALARKFSVEGYPTVVVLDSMGKELTRNSGYDGETPKEYIAKIEALKKN